MIDGARTLLRASRRVVAFSGAGLSAESGVPTFRDAATRGLWLQHDPARLASPEGFAEDATLVTDWYAQRRRSVHAAQPNAAHHALARHGDVINITQNVDDLLDRAGATGVLHLHGRLDMDRCHRACGHEERVDLSNPPPLRACPECGAPMRPAVVWFGEMLPAATWASAERACAACDAMLVIGTAAEVHPAAGLVAFARRHGARIIVINTNPSAASALADVELIGPAGAVVPELLGRE